MAFPTLLGILLFAVPYQSDPWMKDRFPERENESRKLRREFHAAYFTVTTRTFSISRERAARFFSSSSDLMVSYICRCFRLIGHFNTVLR